MDVPGLDPVKGHQKGYEKTPPVKSTKFIQVFN